MPSLTPTVSQRSSALTTRLRSTLAPRHSEYFGAQCVTCVIPPPWGTLPPQLRNDVPVLECQMLRLDNHPRWPALGRNPGARERSRAEIVPPARVDVVGNDVRGVADDHGPRLGRVRDGVDGFADAVVVRVFGEGCASGCEPLADGVLIDRVQRAG